MTGTKCFFWLALLFSSTSCFSDISVSLVIANKSNETITFTNTTNSTSFSISSNSQCIQTVLKEDESSQHFEATIDSRKVHIYIQYVPCPHIAEDIIEVAFLDDKEIVFDSYCLKSDRDLELSLTLSAQYENQQLWLTNEQNSNVDYISQMHKEDANSNGNFALKSIDGATIQLGMLRGKKLLIGNEIPYLSTMNRMEKNKEQAILLTHDSLEGDNNPFTLFISTITLPLSKMPFIQMSLLDGENTHFGSIAATFSPDTEPTNRSLIIGTNEHNQLCFKPDETQALILYKEGCSSEGQVS